MNWLKRKYDSLCMWLMVWAGTRIFNYCVPYMPSNNLKTLGVTFTNSMEYAKQISKIHKEE